MASSLLRKGNLHKGSKVLVNGASGGIGAAAVQLAKISGAEVTGVCGAPRLDYVRSLGADRVIDYAQADFTQNGETYDLIFDVLGKSSFAKCKKSLKPGGIYLLASFKMKALSQMLWTKMSGSQKVVCAMASERTEDLVPSRSWSKRAIQGDHRSLLPVGAGGAGARLRGSGFEEGAGGHYNEWSEWTMKAIIWTAYGSPDVLQLREVEMPAPKDDEVLIRVAAATVTAGDCEMRSLKLPLYLGLPMRLYAGFGKPRRITILGQELAGVVAAGQAGEALQGGRRGIRRHRLQHGGVCRVRLPARGPRAAGALLEIKPANLSFEEAAAAPIGGLEALYYLRQAHIQAGQKVLVNGAGGSIGTLAVQLARSYGAFVTAVDSAGKLEMLGARGGKRNRLCE